MNTNIKQKSDWPAWAHYACRVDCCDRNGKRIDMRIIYDVTRDGIAKQCNPIHAAFYEKYGMQNVYVFNNILARE